MRGLLLEIDQLDTPTVANHHEAAVEGRWTRQQLHTHRHVPKMHAWDLNRFPAVEETLVLRPLDNCEVVSLKDSKEEGVTLKLDKVVDRVVLGVGFVSEAHTVVACVVRDHVGEEEAFGVCNCNTSSTLSHPCLVALRDSVQRWGVRSRLHAGHINDIEYAFVEDSENSHWLELKNVCDALLKTTLASFGPIRLTRSFLKL